MESSLQIRLLWTAVFALSVALVATLALARKDSVTDSAHQLATSSDCPEVVVDPWHKLPLKSKLQQAEAVIVVRLDGAGSEAKAVVTDVIVIKQGAEVSYRVGAEAPHLSRPANSAVTDWGDGAVALLSGSPASIRESYSVHNGRIPGLGDMSLEDFKHMAGAR